MAEMNIVYKDIESLHPYENNPRINDNAVDTVATSIKKYGWKQPLVIDGNGVIVVGHTRYKAAKKLGTGKVPCVLADDLTEEQIKEYRLIDNKSNELSKWDFPVLEGELESLNFDDFGAELDWGLADFNTEDFERFFTDELDSGKEKKPKYIKVTCPDCGKQFDWEV